MNFSVETTGNNLLTKFCIAKNSSFEEFVALF